MGPLLLAAAVAAGCAKMAPPEGGKPETIPPKLVATRPDSLQVYRDFKGSVEFRFDEVVSEGNTANEGLGTGDLERLLLVSPTTSVPQVGWRRNRITVRPREGWKPDRVYRVQLLPGVTDLRNNRSTGGTILTFSTGAPLPSITLEGVVSDWSTGRIAGGALVEAVLLPDSLPYKVLTDSTGYFTIGPLPDGDYLVFASLDQNKNLRRDGREAWDSVRVPASNRVPAELWPFPRDTVGPRIRTLTPVDSVTVTIELSQPLDPAQSLDSTHVRVRHLPDSTAVRVAALLPKPLYDSLQQQRRAAARPDTGTRAAADTARPAPRPAPGPRPGQPVPRITPKPRTPLTDKLALEFGERLAPDTRYEVVLFRVRNANGAALDSTRSVLSIPKPVKPPADSTKADSTAAPPAAARDSTRRP